MSGLDRRGFAIRASHRVGSWQSLDHVGGRTPTGTVRCRDLLRKIAPGATIVGMINAEGTARVFKTRWFAKAARKALIKDDDLVAAIAEVMKGQADDLADLYAAKSADDFTRELTAQELVEIGHEQNRSIQE